MPFTLLLPAFRASCGLVWLLSGIRFPASKISGLRLLSNLVLASQESGFLPLSNQVSCPSDFWSLGLVPLTVKTARKYKISVTSQYLNKLDIWCMDLRVSWVNQINM